MMKTFWKQIRLLFIEVLHLYELDTDVPPPKKQTSKLTDYIIGEIYLCLNVDTASVKGGSTFQRLLFSLRLLVVTHRKK